MQECGYNVFWCFPGTVVNVKSVGYTVNGGSATNTIFAIHCTYNICNTLYPIRSTVV